MKKKWILQLRDILPLKTVIYSTVLPLAMLMASSPGAFASRANAGDVPETEIRSPQDTKTISGTVTNESGEPIPGVTVVVKGTSQGTITNSDGEYTIGEVPDEATLQFSFVGMKTQEVEIDNQTTIDLTMDSEAIALDEVVAVGYGTQKKSHLTASIEEVSGEEVVNRPVNNISDALHSTVAGLNINSTHGGPAANPNINLRGYTGFNSKQSPLILVDGVERSMSDVNPTDVESISVLKDAAASAIYGSRAPFGVILITTKSGQKGEQMQVNYSGNYRIGTPLGMPSWANSYEFAEKVNEQYRNSLRSPLYSEDAIQRMRDYASGKIDYNNIELENGNWGAHWDAHANSDWFDIMFKDQIPSQEHNINFSGGSENTSYYMGLGYNESAGIIKGADDKKDRYSALLKVNTNAADWLNLRLSMNYVKTDQLAVNYRGNGPDYYDIWRNAAATLPNWPDINPNGSPHFLSSGPSMRGEGGDQTNDRNETILKGGFTIKPFEGFNLKGDYTWKNFNRHLNRNTFVIYVTEADGSTRRSARSAQQDEVLRRMEVRNYHTFDLVADYTKQINQHSFYALAGYQEEYSRWTHLIGSQKDLYTTSVPAISTAYNENPSLDDNLGHWATQGIFGRFSYNYAEKYFVEINGRYDAHSKFPPDIRWSFFPSYSAAWNIAEENFWTLPQVNLLKLRGSYTSSGNPGDGNYLYLPTMGTGIGNGDVLLGGSKPNMVFMPPLVSSDLTWSKPKTLGLGIDAVALNNRLDITYDWYQRTIYDQPGPAKILPQTIGASLPSVNNAVSETRGWEFSVKWRDRAFSIMGKPFNYSAKFNISDYVGYVVEYEDNIDGLRSSWTPGQVFGEVYRYEADGIAQNVADIEANAPQGGGWYYPGDLMIKDVNGDGQINAGEGGTWYAMGDREKTGYNYPRNRYGIHLGADWNGFDLSVQLNGVPKWDVYTNNFFVMPAQGNVWNSKWFDVHKELGTWTPETPDNYYPRHSFKTYRPNDQYALDLAHLRIKNLRIGYNLPERWLDNAGLQKVYFYTSIENMGYIYYNSKIKYEPEIIANYGGMRYPPQKQFSFGVNIGI
ncbi:MAG: SusC/RagA family TonB-linked outer membrane protein [Bacteroidota bacterium]